MATRGTNLAKNPFKTAMASSYTASGQITQYVNDVLDSNQALDPRIADLFTHFEPFNTRYHSALNKHYGAFNSRGADTIDIETFEAGIPAEVGIWWRKLTDVYAQGTTQYNTLWAGGKLSFYKRSRQSNINRMKTLETAIGSDAALAPLKTIVETYASTYQMLVSSQTSDKVSLKTGTSDIDASRKLATDALFYVYCGLVMIFLPDMDKVLAYFPMELIYKSAKIREYRLLVPMSSSRKICSRKWKKTDKIKMVNNRDVDLEIGLTADSAVLPTTWYTLPANSSVNIIPADLGATANKFVIVKNIDLVTTGDITFTLFEA